MYLAARSILRIHKKPGGRPKAKTSRSRGFSLIITLLMMVLLTIIALGLLSLSSISLRTVAQDSSNATARTNARCALMLAIGQLQKQMGTDQRISAPATLAVAQPPASHETWTGTWKSAPATVVNPPKGREADFAGWLISSPKDTSLQTVSDESGSSIAMERLSDGRETRVPVLKTPNGNIGWWTADEALKATVDLAAPTITTEGGYIADRHATSRLAPENIQSIGTFPTDDATTSRLITPGQIKLAAVTRPPDLNRTCTTGAQSVLTDVKKGGLKRDFSTLFEMPEANITGYGAWKGTSAIDDKASYIYGDPRVAIGARWNHLFAYYNLYKDVNLVANEPQVQLATKPLIDWNLADQQKDYGDEKGGFRYPRISRILYVLSYSAVAPTGTATQYGLRLGIDMYVTLWNPFDVRMVWPANTTFLCKFGKGLPFRFNWFVNGTQQGNATQLGDIISASGGDAEGTGLFLMSQFLSPGAENFNMAPGETRLFSLAQTKSTFQNRLYNDFAPGLFYNDVLFYNKVLGSAGTITGNAGDQISVGMEPYNEGVSYSQKAQYVDFWIFDRQRGSPYYEHRGEILADNTTQFVEQLKALKKEDLPSVTMSDAAAKKRPFAAFVMEMKSANDSVLPTTSFLSSGATRLSSRLSSSPEDFSLDRLEYKLEKLDSFQSDLIQCSLPGDPNGENHSYIGSGRLPLDGRTHVTALSIPSMPPMSVASFRHASIGDGGSCLRATLWAPKTVSCTPPPTYSDQAVGNSYAHPRVPGNAFTVPGVSPLYDHSFMANDALWDGWFFSSLASRTADAATVSLKDRWSDFVDGKKPLLNPRFSPWKGSKSGDKLKSDVFNGTDINPDAHRLIASDLMLKGGFNVNSTSVDAWTAFLSSTRGKSIRKLNRTGSAGGTLVKSKGTLFSRGDYVLDDAVDNSSRADSQYTGFRDLSDDQIRSLAGKVVAEIKKRGPFLNVSEFVNRRLGSDQDLALCGALQAAIDATTLNDKLKASGKAGNSAPVSGTFANLKAAQLNTSTGAPGWLMQGDILDPLGPFITVRGDTFRVRAYGDATDKLGNVIARAWCEAVVQRTPDYLNKVDLPQTFPPADPANLSFGREFRILSFRWLSSNEI